MRAYQWSLLLSTCVHVHRNLITIYRLDVSACPHHYPSHSNTELIPFSDIHHIPHTRVHVLVLIHHIHQDRDPGHIQGADIVDHHILVVTAGHIVDLIAVVILDPGVRIAIAKNLPQYLLLSSRAH